MFKLEITGTFGLRIEGKEAEPVTYEFMFDHFAVDVEGAEPHVVADALAVAVHRAMVPTERAVIDQLERLYPWTRRAQVKHLMLALAEAARCWSRRRPDAGPAWPRRWPRPGFGPS